MSGSGVPLLGVWRSVDGELEGGWPYISALFPEPAGAIVDAWCYETPGLHYVGGRTLPGGGLELHHRWDGQAALLVTTATPERSAVRIVAELTAADGTPLHHDPPVHPVLNVCWQVRRSPLFATWPDAYPGFAERCFIFTERGPTLLSDTVRLPIPCRPADDRYNRPPWVQMYLPVWRPPLKASPDSWAAYSPDRYVHGVIGVMTRDRRYLAAIATPGSTWVAQAWHDCLHNLSEWVQKPNGAGYAWQSMLYLLPNDPLALLQRATHDLSAAVPGEARQCLQ